MVTSVFIYFVYLKIIVLILCGIFLIGIVYYIKKLKIISQWKESWQEWWGIIPSMITTSKSHKEWQRIESFLAEPYESSWKLAVIQAQGIIKKTLNSIGYSGQGGDKDKDDFEQILEELKARNYQNLEILYQLHQVRQRIISDKNFSLSQSKAKEMVGIYKKFWEELLEVL
ncbi:MAG: hypothetical protein PHG13_02595 [Candidatus Pacebacteria bacterium]|jgi:hypothetical protein|nr:hypothetical protein [Candidatus Paceibacterota bacterium]MDD5722036.1 hypothetical protein [Candidatus Paceibacterota bacterium]